MTDTQFCFEWNMQRFTCSRGENQGMFDTKGIRNMNLRKECHKNGLDHFLLVGLYLYRWQQGRGPNRQHISVCKSQVFVVKSLLCHKLKHKGRKWCSIPLDFRADLILKSAEMTEIGRTLLFPSQLICMDSKTREILSISVILADLRIKSARKSSAKINFYLGNGTL